MGNPAIRQQPNGDVDIEATVRPDGSEQAADEAAAGEPGPGPEPSVDPANLDHPDELMGE